MSKEEKKITIKTNMDITDYEFQWDLFYDNVKKLSDWFDILETEGIIEPATKTMMYDTLERVGTAFNNFVPAPKEIKGEC